MEDVETTQDEEQIVTEEQQDNAQDQVDSIDWKAEALKNKAIADRLKKKLNQPIIQHKEDKVDDEIVKDVKFLKTIEEKRQFGYENGLSPEETDKVFQISGGKPTKETLEDPFVKAGLEGLRSKKRLENNIPSSSSTSSPFQGKQFSEMTPEERKKSYEERSKKFTGK